MPTEEVQDLQRRAMAAYFRGGDTDHPSASASSVEELGGKHYVMLRGIGGVLACYRVRNDGKLKRLVRIPADLREA